MLTLAMLALLTGPAAGEPTFERMVQCRAYHETWQWDEHDAGRKVPKDTAWFLPFRRQLYAAGEAKGLSETQVAQTVNAAARALRPALTPEQNADWDKCRQEFDWKPDPDGATIN